MSTDTDLARQEQSENAQPGRVGERLEERFHLQSICLAIYLS